MGPTGYGTSREECPKLGPRVLGWCVPEGPGQERPRPGSRWSPRVSERWGGAGPARARASRARAPDPRGCGTGARGSHGCPRQRVGRRGRGARCGRGFCARGWSVRWAGTPAARGARAAGWASPQPWRGAAPAHAPGPPWAPPPGAVVRSGFKRPQRPRAGPVCGRWRRRQRWWWLAGRRARGAAVGSLERGGCGARGRVHVAGRRPPGASGGGGTGRWSPSPAVGAWPACSMARGLGSPRILSASRGSGPASPCPLGAGLTGP